MATIQERLRKLVEPIDGTMILSDACQVMPEALDRVRRHTNRTPALAWEAATHIDALEKRVKELEAERSEARQTITHVANELENHYGRMAANTYPGPPKELIIRLRSLLNGGAKP